MKTYNMAIVGFGGMANWHRELLSGTAGWYRSKVGRIDRLSILGSFDIRAERQEAARGFGLKAYESFEEILADPQVDVVLCATPNDVHKEVVIRSLEAGKHVVCEKPVALNSGEFAEMIAVAERTDKVFVVHQNRRWDMDYLAMKKIYDDRLLGDVFRIESRVHGSRGIPGDWRQYPEKGGGMVLDWGVHILDQALQMIPGKISRIYATFTHVTNELAEDGFTVELTFEDGLVFLLEVGTSHFIGLPRWYMLGRDGTAVIHDWNLQGEMVRITDWSKNDAVPIVTAAGLTKTMAPRTADTIRKESLPEVESDISDFYRNVIAAMDGSEELLVKLPEVMRNMKLMEAIFTSARTRQTVDFE